MNAKDLELINWTLMNGQINERIQLTSLISQILELTSRATHGRKCREDNQSFLESQPNDSDADYIVIDDEICQANGSNGNSDSSQRRSVAIDEGPSGAEHRKQTPIENSTRQLTESNDDGRRIGPETQSQLPSRENKNTFDLKELLKSDECADIIEYYEENGAFDERTRKNFMRIMCGELMKGPRVSNTSIDQISTDVYLVFLKEKKVFRTTKYWKHRNKLRTSIKEINEIVKKKCRALCKMKIF